MLSRYAILLDGGFVTKKLQSKLNKFPTAADVDVVCKRIAQHPTISNRDLLRIYFYDASPAKDKLTNPIDGSMTDLSSDLMWMWYVSGLPSIQRSATGTYCVSISTTLRQPRTS